MLHNDISNKRGFVIGFRCENSLIKYKDNTVKDKVANFFLGKSYRAEVNNEVLSLMKHLYWNTDYTVVLIIDEKNYTKEAKEYLEDFPFNQVGQVIKNISEVTMMLNTGELSYYVTNDIIDRQLVNSKYAVSVKEFNTILRREVNRFEKY